MKSTIVGLLAETALHPGAGQSRGVIDLPVAREHVTHYPVVFGSSIKGAFRYKMLTDSGDAEVVNAIFGKEDAGDTTAGGVLFSDARLLLLPVRSLSGTYVWLTCPHILERFVRDATRAGVSVSIDIDANTPADGFIMTRSQTAKVYVEERYFERMPVNAVAFDSLISILKGLISDSRVQQRLESQVGIVSDADFAWFAKYGLQVVTRNVLKSEMGSKSSSNLWCEEYLPQDTLLYSMFMLRNVAADEAYGTLLDTLAEKSYVQIGGNETIGQGWCNITRFQMNQGAGEA
ncbi:type III-B CRISPR module RAMP protein Cmr4 [Oleidesulfovibrio alaskensis]